MDVYVPPGFRGDDYESLEEEKYEEEIQIQLSVLRKGFFEGENGICQSSESEASGNADSALNPMIAGIGETIINHPPHYTFGKYEVIDVLEDWFPTDPLLWQVGKYISRAGRKGSKAECLKKARFYLERAISKAEEGEDGG